MENCVEAFEKAPCMLYIELLCWDSERVTCCEYALSLFSIWSDMEMIQSLESLFVLGGIIVKIISLLIIFRINQSSEFSKLTMIQIK